MSKSEVRSVCSMCNGLCWHHKYVSTSIANPMCKLCRGSGDNNKLMFMQKGCYCLSERPVLTLVSCNMCDGKGYVTNDIEALLKFFGKEISVILLTRLQHTLT